MPNVKSENFEQVKLEILFHISSLPISKGIFVDSELIFKTVEDSRVFEGADIQGNAAEKKECTLSIMNGVFYVRQQEMLESIYIKIDHNYFKKVKWMEIVRFSNSFNDVLELYSMQTDLTNKEIKEFLKYSSDFKKKKGSIDG